MITGKKDVGNSSFHLISRHLFPVAGLMVGVYVQGLRISDEVNIINPRGDTPPLPRHLFWPHAGWGRGPPP